MKCPACNNLYIESSVYELPLRLKDNSIKTSISRCRLCGLHFRDIDFTSPQVITRFEVASYVSEESEIYYMETRRLYFENLLRIVETYRKDAEPKTLLDIGCSYGHMMELFHDTGRYEVYGIEINAPLRKRLAEKSYNVFETLDDVPRMKFDVISMIDSLYYFESLVKTMNIVRNLLKDDGVLLIRVTNRPWLADIFLSLGVKVPHRLMGDSKYFFTNKAMNSLLSGQGFVVDHLIVAESGKTGLPMMKRFVYFITGLISRAGLIVSPGLIYIVRKYEKIEPFTGF